MSAGYLGTIGSVTTGQLQQTRSADADRAAQEVARQARTAASGQRAENAAGVGETEQDEATSERDADGRRLWERQDGRPPQEESPPPQEPVASRDPTGQSGTQLDLSG